MSKLDLTGLKKKTVRECLVCPDWELRRAALECLGKDADAGKTDGSSPKSYVNLSDQAILSLYRNGDPQLRMKAKEQLVNNYSDFVYQVIWRKFGHLAQQGHKDDLYQVGSIGMLKSLDKYDGSYAFISYCYPFIIYEMAHYEGSLRGNSTVHFGRLQRKVRKTIDTLTEEGKEPSVEEICQRTGMSRKIVEREVLAIEHENWERVPFPDGEDPGSNVKLYSAFEDDLIMKIDLEVAMNTLSERDRIALYMFVWEQIPITQLASVFGLKKSGMHKRLYKSARSLKDKMEGYGEGRKLAD